MTSHKIIPYAESNVRFLIPGREEGDCSRVRNYTADLGRTYDVPTES